MTLSDTELEELKVLAEKATPGPWYSDNGLSLNTRAPGGGDDSYIANLNDGEYVENPKCHEDAAFIAASREAIPQLISDLQESREALAKILRTANDQRDHPYRLMNTIRVTARRALKE